MQLIVNGEPRETSEKVSLDEFLTLLNLRSQMVVVERNGEIVPRGTYGDTLLTENDILEIVQMMAGG